MKTKVRNSQIDGIKIKIILEILDEFLKLI